MSVPQDFLDAVEARPKAKAFFLTLDRKNRYSIYYRLHTAMKPETRAKRMSLMLAQLERGETFHSPSATTHNPNATTAACAAAGSMLAVGAARSDRRGPGVPEQLAEAVGVVALVRDEAAEAGHLLGSSSVARMSEICPGRDHAPRRVTTPSGSASHSPHDTQAQKSC